MWTKEKYAYEIKKDLRNCLLKPNFTDKHVCELELEAVLRCSFDEPEECRDCEVSSVVSQWYAQIKKANNGVPKAIVGFVTVEEQNTDDPYIFIYIFRAVAQCFSAENFF
ncbi:MAG: hypothetical protein BHW58_02600 [Azospirillum sp. 51_20]|nr:MAG: hypothetical protein BHW58_02600 [Azospirillum sp. 51_20]